MAEDKNIDIKEFRELGYLQELNRLILHPLGLALSVVVEEDGTEKLGAIWDYREEKERVFYGLKNSSEERVESFRNKAAFIREEFLKAERDRMETLGFLVEPIE